VAGCVDRRLRGWLMVEKLANELDGKKQP